MLIIIVSILAPVFMLIGFYLPSYLSGGDSWNNTCAVGFSGVDFAFMLVWAFTGDRIVRFACICFPKWIIPFVYLIVNKLMLPAASFTGHLSGILAPLIINSAFLYLLLPWSSWLRDAESQVECFQTWMKEVNIWTIDSDFKMTGIGSIWTPILAIYRFLKWKIWGLQTHEEIRMAWMNRFNQI